METVPPTSPKSFTVCVYCGSSPGARPAYRDAADAVGASIARRGWQLVYGGGKVGLMGAVADAAFAAGGHITGIIPDALVSRELAHRGVTELIVTASMHERKARMASLSDTFLALPGGIGTFEEYIEALTWTRLGIHAKSCGLLNVAGYYDPMLAMFERSVTEGFMRPEHYEPLLVGVDVEELLDRLGRVPHSAPPDSTP